MSAKTLRTTTIMILLGSLLLYAQDASTSKPKSTAATKQKSNQVIDPVKGNLIVQCDLDCIWQLDKQDKGKIVAGHYGRAVLEMGWHTIVAQTIDGKDRFSTTLQTVGSTQATVSVPLRDRRADRRKVESAEIACDAGAAVACADAAESYLFGWGVKGDASKVVALSKRACDSGNGRGCGTLSFMYYRIDQFVNKERGAEAAQQGCYLGDGQSCFNLAFFGYKLGWGVDKDDQAAYDTYVKGCESGWGASCASLSSFTFSLSLFPGRDRSQFYLDVKRMMQKGCDLREARACDELIRYYESTDSARVAEIQSRAEKFNGKDCDGLDRHECERLDTVKP